MSVTTQVQTLNASPIFFGTPSDTALVQCVVCEEFVPASKAVPYDLQRTLGNGLFEDLGVGFVCQACEEDYALYGDGFRE